MNGERSPSKEEIQNLPNSTLVLKATKEHTWRAKYANELHERVAQGDLDLKILDQKLRDSPGNSPDTPKGHAVRDTWRRVKNSTLPIKFLADEIAKSGWDYSDPARRVRMPPFEVKELLDGFVYLRPDEYYADQPEGTQSILGMIIDAYGRWYMRTNVTGG